MPHNTIDRPRRTRTRVLAGAVVLFAVLAAGCSSGSDSNGSSIRPPTVSVEAPAGPGAGIAPMAESRPLRVQIPAIGVESDLMDLGLQDDGTIEVPPGGFPAGWYVNAPTPGEIGPAIVAGHVDWRGDPGVFFDLRDLDAGDEVLIPRADGSTAVFRVIEVQQFPKDEFPTDTVYGDIDHAGLRLITCGGSFDSSARSYDDNIIAFAELVEARAA